VRTYLSELWARREYAIEVPRSNLRAKHMNTLLGNLWHVLNPMLLIGVYYVVFGLIVHRVAEGVDHYISFLAVGVFTYRYTQASVQQGANSITGNEGLIRSIYFPRAILPIATVVEQLLLLVPVVVLVLLITVLTGEGPGFHWLLVPVVFAFQTLFNLGASFFAARISDTFRDFQNVLPHLFRVLFYLSGVLFSVDRWVSNPTILQLFALNPAYAYVSAARYAFLGTPVSSTIWISGAAWAVIALVAGFFYFYAAEPRYGRG
jgi:teichoic acid transport system permease protein